MTLHLPNHYATETAFFASVAAVVAAALVVYAVARWFDRSLNNAVTGPVTS